MPVLTPKDVATKLEAILTSIGNRLEQPAPVVDPAYPRWRYEHRSPQLPCFLKVVKYVSTLYGAICLEEAGHVQEVGVLCRVMDDCQNDTLFMIIPLGDEGELSTNQRRFIDDFFQEEFDDPIRILTSDQKRTNVSRQKVHAGLAKVASSEVNPSDAQRVLRP